MVRLLPWSVVVLTVASMLMGREARGQAAAPPAAAQEKAPTAEQRIRKALDEPTTFDFTETPLSKVLEDIRKRHNIEVQIDNKALADTGHSSDTPITRKLKGISLRSALKLILSDIDLTWITKNEVLLITNQETVNDTLVLETYDVTDLVACRDEKGEIWLDSEPLMDVITSTISPTKWDRVGGPASLSELVIGETAILVVDQTDAFHEEIVSLLAKLREIVRKHGDKQTPPRRDRPPRPDALKIGGCLGSIPVEPISVVVASDPVPSN